MSMQRYVPGQGMCNLGVQFKNIGPAGPPGATGPQGISANRGNLAIVDSVYGNDSTASVGGYSFQTIQAALAVVTSGQSIWILPGTYTLSTGITIPNGVSVRGFSLQTVIIQLNVTNSATMVTMGENCRVEDCTFNLTCTGTTNNVVLKGFVFTGTTSQTSKLRTSLVSVRNSAMITSITSTVTGIEFTGSGSLNASTFSFNSIKGCTINVYSNGSGNKRGLLVSGSAQVSTRDTNVYVAQPVDVTSNGSYIGVETADVSSGIGSIQLRSTTVGVVFPSAGQSYTASDILQSYPVTILNPTYLASPGIQVGPGTDLVTKSAGGKGFSTYVYPTTVTYGLKGSMTSAGSGYLWPGIASISGGSYPDPGLPAAYFRIQQPSLLCGMSGSLNAAPGGSNTVTLSVYYTPTITPSTTAAIYTGTISGTTLTVDSGSVSYGAIAVGQPVLGSGIAINTYITAGSGTTWTVFPSQTVAGATFTGNSIGVNLVPSSITGTIRIGQTITGPGVPAGTTIIGGDLNTYFVLSAPPNPPLNNASCKATIAILNGGPASSFDGSITGTTLTLNSPVTGSIAIGQYITGTSITGGTYITAGSGNTWTLSSSQTTLTVVPLKTNGMLPTPYTITFQPGDTDKTFYSASQRFNTGDRLHLFAIYTSGSPTNAGHDVTMQLDLF